MSPRAKAARNASVAAVEDKGLPSEPKKKSACVAEPQNDDEAADETIGKKIPKAVGEVRAMFAANKKEITPDTLKDMGTKDYNKLAANFRNSLCQPAKEQYKALKSDAERRKWIHQYVMDPEFGTLTGWNDTRVFAKTTSVDEEEWKTQEQIEHMLQSKQHAQTIIDSNELESRPHEQCSLARLGVLQYRWISSKVQRAHGQEESAGLRCKADLKASEFTKVKSDMLAEGLEIPHGTGKKRKVSAPKVKDKADVTPEEQAITAALAEKNNSFRKCKSMLDRCILDVQIASQELEKVRGKGCPESMYKFFEAGLAQFKEKVKVRQAEYAKLLTAVEFQPGLLEIETAKNKRHGCRCQSSGH